MSGTAHGKRVDGDENAALRVVAAGRYIRMMTRGSWEYVERIGVTGIVAIVAITDDRQVVLVEQYRPPVDRQVIEIPAGLAGDTKDAGDEALEDAARRELLEETGFTSRRMSYLTEGPPSSGSTSEHITFYYAAGLMRVAAGGGDTTEAITVHLVDLATIDCWLSERMQDGCLIDPKIYTGMYFVHQMKSGER